MGKLTPFKGGHYTPKMYITRLKQDIFLLETFAPIMFRSEFGFEVFSNIEGLPKVSLFNSISEGCGPFATRLDAEHAGYWALLAVKKAAEKYIDQQQYYQALSYFKEHLKYKLLTKRLAGK